MEGAVKVLHIDDDPDFIQLAANQLEQIDPDLTIRTATDPTDGLERFRQNSFDCVVTDYEMPKMDGIDVLRAIRQHDPALPVILFTGRGSESVASDAISAGVTDYLQKQGKTEQYTLLANRIHNAVDRYRSQQALQDRTHRLQRYRDLVNSMQETACIYDEYARFETVNQALADWYDTTPEALEGQASELIPRIRDQRDGDPFQELLDGERKEVYGEISGEFPNRGYAVLEYRLTPLIIEESIDGVVGVVRDVTEHRTVEQRLSAYIDHASDILAIITEDGVFADLSPAIERITGYSPAELVGNSIFSYVHPDDRDRVVDQFTEMIHANEPVFKRVEYRFKHTDGQWRWLESISTGEYDRAADGYVITTRDITDRKHREQELSATKEQLDLALSAANFGVFDWAPESETITYDHRVPAIIDWPTDQFEASIEFWTDQVHPADLPTVEADLEALSAGETECSETEYRMQTADGDWTWIRSCGTVVERDGSGKPTRVVGIHQNITEQKKRERQLEAQNERLEEFASIVSHDLVAPLNVAQMRLNLAQAGTNSEHHEAIAATLDRMEQIIDNVLWLVRRGQDPDLDEITLRAVAEETWSLLADPSTDAELRYLPLDATGGIQIRADGHHIRKLLENLFQNAIDHTDEPVTVIIGEQSDGFYVADDGPGIPLEDRDQIFEAGYSSGSGGTGLGLRIVKQVVDAHGWSIHVDEHESGGAKFEITGVDVVNRSISN